MSQFQPYKPSCHPVTPLLESTSERVNLASAALTGIMSKMASTTMPQPTRAALAKLAVQMADETLAALDKTEVVQ